MAQRRSLIILGGGLALAGVVAGIAALTTGATPAELDLLALGLDGQLREASAATEARADTLAQLPRLAWAVATDEQTVLDLTSDELAFRPQANESIEIGQVLRADHRVVPLLHLGLKDVVHLPLAEPGRHLLVSNGRLYSVVVTAVQPRTRANELTGAVGLSRPVDLEPLRAGLKRFGASAELMLGDQTITVGSSTRSSESVRMHVSSEPGLQVTFRVPRYPRSALLLDLLALTIAFVAVFVASLLYRRESKMDVDPPLPELVPEDHR